VRNPSGRRSDPDAPKSDAERYVEQDAREWALSLPASIMERARLPGWTQVAELRYQGVLESTGLAAAQDQAAAVVRRRPRGRPKWTTGLFDARYAEAVKAAGGSTADRDVAPEFRGQSGNLVGVEPETLTRLRQRRARGDMPER